MRSLKIFTVLTLTIMGIWGSACNQQAPSQNKSNASVKPEVEVTHVQTGTISDTVEVLAMSWYPDKNMVTAPISGYLTSVHIQPGNQVNRQDPLFTIQTKESAVLKGDSGNDVQGSSGSFGTVNLNAQSAGKVININHYKGDYVQEGNILCTVVHPEHAYFKVFVPYRLKNSVQTNGSISLQLPDGTRVKATYQHSLGQVDAPSQTGVYLFKPDGNIALPEGAKATAYIATDTRNNAQLLPKSAVLTNEKMDAFWIMKVGNDSLAHKIPVQRGLVSADQVEIRKPEFSQDDKIIISGNYGLEDSTNVRIIQ